MKKQDISVDLVKKTVDALDQIEDAVLGVKTGVRAGDGGCKVWLCPQPLYGVGVE